MRSKGTTKIRDDKNILRNRRATASKFTHDNLSADFFN